MTCLYVHLCCQVMPLPKYCLCIINVVHLLNVLYFPTVNFKIQLMIIDLMLCPISFIDNNFNISNFKYVRI